MADNTVLDSGSGGDTIATDDIGGVKFPRTKLVVGADGTNDGDVSDSNPLPIDDAGGSITVDNGGTFAVQVDSALPTGSNAIGKLAANSGVDIGDVDVTSIVPGTSATNLGKAIDSASGSTDTGVAALAIRDDSLSALTPAEGDYAPLRVSSTGALHVTGGGGGTEYTVDNAAPASPTGSALLAERDDALGGITPVEGDWSQLFCDANGALWTSISASLPAGDNNIGNVDIVSVPAPLNVTGGGAESSALRVTLANDSTGVLSVDDNGGNLSVDWAGTVPPIGAGTEAAALRVTVATDSTGTLTVDNAGTFAVQAAQSGSWSISTVTTVSTVTNLSQMGGQSISMGTGTRDAGTQRVTVATDDVVPVSQSGAWSVTADLGTDNDVQGAAAHDAAVSGNPFLQGGEARSSEGTAVGNGDVVRLMADLVGKLVTQPFAPSDLSQDGQTTHTDTSNQELFAAAGAGVRNFLTDIAVSNTSSTDTEVLIKDGATEIWRLPAPANGGAVHRFGTPLRGTANTALNISTSGSVSTVTCSGSGYTGR